MFYSTSAFVGLAVFQISGYVDFASFFPEFGEISLVFFYSWQWYMGPSSEVKTFEGAFEGMELDVFGDVALNVTKANDRVMAIQERIRIEGFPNDLLLIQSDALADLDRVLGQQEVLLKEKSRIKWLVEEDQNTNFFHYLLKHREGMRSLSSI